MWFRRDLRLADNPALLAAGASAQGAPVLGLFVIDPTLVRTAGAPRLTFLYRCLRSLDGSLGGRLVVRHGDPTSVVAAVAAEAGATTVHVSEDFGPYGRRRDGAVAAALRAGGAELVRTGSPYAVPPGTVLTGDGTPFKVFTSFSRAWRTHGWAPPCGPVPPMLRWVPEVRSDGVPPDPVLDGAELPEAGEGAARAAFARFAASSLDDYADGRDQPARDASSRLSPYLKYGCIHPRQVLAGLVARRGPGPDAFERELCWRDFYADILWHRPDSAREHWDQSFDAMRYDHGAEAHRRFDAWACGRTGYPIVDAGMRQLLGEAWVHNRVRMVVASFFVKDLHLPWQLGARWFMTHLVDGDLASNNHGWQWVAGSGTDAAPYFRVFNPVVQGQRFDPSGEYVRRWVPELRGVAGPGVQDPAVLDGLRRALDAPAGLVDYPLPMVDHATERAEALARYQLVQGARAPRAS